MKALKKWIKKNSQKSELEKRSIAIFYSFLITSFIVIIWLVTLINTSSYSYQNMANIQNIQSAPASPVSSIITSVKGFFNSTIIYNSD